MIPFLFEFNLKMIPALHAKAAPQIKYRYKSVGFVTYKIKRYLTCKKNRHFYAVLQEGLEMAKTSYGL